MSKKNKKMLAVFASVLATGTVFGGLIPTTVHADDNGRPASNGYDLTNYFQQDHGSSDLDNEDPGKRDDWFYGQRFGLDQKPNPNARNAAIAEAKKLPMYKSANLKTGNLTSKVAPTLQWQNIGPKPIEGEYWTKGNVSGRVTSVSASADGKTLVIGSAGGGVWSSDDGGQNWNPLTDNTASLAIGAVAVAPSDSKTIYAGTGENPLSFGADAYYGQGLLVTNDGGTTWTNLQQPLFNGQRITSLIVDDKDSKKIMFGSTIGLYSSTDGGVTVNKVSLTDINGNALPDTYQVMNVQKNGKTVIAVIGKYGVFRSTDGGTTFKQVTRGIVSGTVGHESVAIGNTAVAFAPSSPNVVYASVTNQDQVSRWNDKYHTPKMGDLTGLYVSKDGGASWTQIKNAPEITMQSSYYLDGLYSQGWYDNAIAVDPSNPNKVTMAGIGIYQTTNGGKTWSNIVNDTTNIHPDQHSLSYDKAGDLFIGNDGGVFEITKTGAHKNLNTNLVLTQDYPGMTVYNNGQQVLTGAQDNGSQMYYGPQAWRSVWTGDGAETLHTPNNPDDFYISYVNGDLYHTTNGGHNVFDDYQYIAAPLNSSEWVAPIALASNAQHPNMIFEGGDNVYMAPDSNLVQNDYQGDVSGWTQLTAHDKNDPNVTDASGREYNVTAMAVTNDGQTIYAGYGNGYLEESTDGGTTWTAISPNGNVWTDPAVARNNWITSITIDPKNSQNIYVTESGYRPLHYTSQGHVWHRDLSQQGSTWQDLSGLDGASGLPDAPVNGLALEADGTLVAASDVGVFVSSGDGNWTNLGAGLPDVEVVDVKVAGGVVYAATHGRGTWEVSLTQGTNTPSSVSVNTETLPEGSSSYVYGQVVDASGNPVAGQQVQVTVGENIVGTATTAADGNYTLTYKNAAKVGDKLAVTATVLDGMGAATTVTTEKDVPVDFAPVGSITMNTASTVVAGGTLDFSGIAKDATGTPIANASIDLIVDGTEYFSAKTDAQGHYDLNMQGPKVLKDADGNLANKATFWVAWQQNESVVSSSKTVTFVPAEANQVALSTNAKDNTIATKAITLLSGSLVDEYGNSVILKAGTKVNLSVNGKAWKSVALSTKNTFSIPFSEVAAGTYEVDATTTVGGKQYTGTVTITVE